MTEEFTEITIKTRQGKYSITLFYRVSQDEINRALDCAREILRHDEPATHKIDHRTRDRDTV